MAEKKLNLQKPATKGDADPDLQAILGSQAENGEQENTGGKKPTPEAPEAPKAPEAKTAKSIVTFYTRKGDPFDSKTGLPRPVTKHVVTRAEWMRIQDRLARLGYTVTKVEE